MPGDPADVSGAPVHVVVAMIENILEGQRRVEHVTGNRVEDALRTGTGHRAAVIRGVSGEVSGVKERHLKVSLEQQRRTLGLPVEPLV